MSILNESEEVLSCGGQTPGSSILVVDDHEDVRDTVIQLLASEGYRVHGVAREEDALALAAEHHIDAFLLDVEMPGMGGINLCRMIRAMDQYRVTPILFITGMGERNGVVDAFAAGCNDFINKPIDGLILRARLKGHLQRMEYLEQLDRARQRLNQYLSKRTREVVETAARTGTLPRPEQRDVVVLFTDIRGFTSLAEQMDPDRLFSVLSSQLADQVKVIHEHGGYVDKFGGDGVMAVFDGENRALQSCHCALRIVEKALTGGAEDEKLRKLGIGIHMGRAVIGNIGSPEHLDYSIIGTTVNLAARLCGQAEALSIVVSKAVRDVASVDRTLHFHHERQVAIRGLKDPVTVYALSVG